MRTGEQENSMIKKKKIVRCIEDMKFCTSINVGQYITGWNDVCDRILAEIQKGCFDVRRKSKGEK